MKHVDHRHAYLAHISTDKFSGILRRIVVILLGFHHAYNKRICVYVRYENACIDNIDIDISALRVSHA